MKKVVMWGLIFFATQCLLMLLIVGGLVLLYGWGFGQNLQRQREQYEEKQIEEDAVQAEADYPYCSQYSYCFSDGKLYIRGEDKEKLYTFETISFDENSGRLITKDGDTTYLLTVRDGKLLPDQDWWYLPYVGSYSFMEEDFTVQKDMTFTSNGKKITSFTPILDNHVRIVYEEKSYSCLICNGEIIEYFEIE